MVAIVQTSARATFAGSGGASITSSTTLAGCTAANLLAQLNNTSAAPATGTPNMSVNDGNAYTVGAQTAFNYQTTNWVESAIHFLPNISSGTHIAVSTNNNANTFSAYGYSRAIEVSGLLTASPLDTGIGTSGAVNATGTNTTATTGSSGTFAQASELVLAVYSTASGGNVTISEPSGFTNIDNNPTQATFAGFGMGSMDYDIISVNTALNPSWGASSGGSLSGWCASMCALKAATASVTEPQLERGQRGVNRGINRGRA